MRGTATRRYSLGRARRRRRGRARRGGGVLSRCLSLCLPLLVFPPRKRFWRGSATDSAYLAGNRERSCVDLCSRRVDRSALLRYVARLSWHSFILPALLMFAPSPALSRSALRRCPFVFEVTSSSSPSLAVLRSPLPLVPLHVPYVLAAPSSFSRSLSFSLPWLLPSSHSRGLPFFSFLRFLLPPILPPHITSLSVCPLPCFS